ncbi:O-antigen ligase family protein [Candidatus Jorgensenbacteria bacterium]|nr:O-antigen ligase family protein [Candidatus Jorgensenbacteria bacterium]
MNSNFRKKLINWICLLFIFAIPFGTKKFLFFLPFPFTNNAVGEYSSVFLYGTDIIGFVFVVLVFLFLRKVLSELCKQWWMTAVFVGLSLISISQALNVPLALYASLRLVFVILAALAVAAALKSGYTSIERILTALGASAVFQAIAAFLQFLFQRSVGLKLLGESFITETSVGVARATVEGAELLRAYGTMAHANILAAFLVVGLVSFYCLYFRTNDLKKVYKLFIVLSIFMLWLGLVFTFSRSGWIVAGIATVATLCYGFLNKQLRNQTAILFLVLVFILGLLFSTLNWAIFPRAHFTSHEFSVAHRWEYNKIGWELMQKHPFGVGVGNQLVSGVEEGIYKSHGLTWFWSWQPIHNIYLLIGSEIGFLGLAAFLLLVGWLLIKRSFDFISIMFIGLLVFGLFDHFTWDLQSGRLMFWVVLGILMGYKNQHLKSN